jgi:hypothetical protein
MQHMLHFRCKLSFLITQDPVMLYKLLYLYIFLIFNFNPSGFGVSLSSLHK